MDLNRHAAMLPAIPDWINRTLNSLCLQKRSMYLFSFRRLSQDFSTDFLNRASVVITNPLSIPSLSELGLRGGTRFELQPMGGITYLDSYFLLLDVANHGSLQFHELVHVIQWWLLGPQSFLLHYAAGLLEWGCLDSPQKKMANSHSGVSISERLSTVSNRKCAGRRWRWDGNHDGKVRGCGGLKPVPATCHQIRARIKVKMND
jgi:hypothetical protein